MQKLKTKRVEKMNQKKRKKNNKRKPKQVTTQREKRGKTQLSVKNKKSNRIQKGKKNSERRAAHAAANWAGPPTGAAGEMNTICPPRAAYRIHHSQIRLCFSSKRQKDRLWLLKVNGV